MSIREDHKLVILTNLVVLVLKTQPLEPYYST